MDLQLGGYAALVLASLIEKTIAIAECPQIYLDRHPGSLSIMKEYCPEKLQSLLPNVQELIRSSNGKSEFYLVSNAFDHHVKDHILPLVNFLKDSVQDITLNYLIVHLYFDQRYNKGHTALNIDDAIPILKLAQNKTCLV